MVSFVCKEHSRETDTVSVVSSQNTRHDSELEYSTGILHSCIHNILTALQGATAQKEGRRCVYKTTYLALDPLLVVKP